MSGLVDSLTGNGKNYNDYSNNIQAPNGDEQRLIDLNTQLAQKQLDNINQMQPYQQQQLDYSTAQMKDQSAYESALNSAITPEQRAAADKQQFDIAQRLGPMQADLAQMQLDALKQGGRATDQQKADIGAATDAAITAGTGDIDIQTKRGIGMISDELANSRGLRLSDSPIGSEAALLERAAGDQKSSLINNLRSNQASAVLNYPLAVQGMSSGINMNQQNLNSAATNFQAQLRQQAYQNRISLSGQNNSAGIGLASVGGGAGTGTLGSLTSARMQNYSGAGSGSNPAQYMTAYGGFIKNSAGPLGQMMGGG